MSANLVDNVPVFSPFKERQPRTVRIRVKKRKNRDFSLSNITPQQKKALMNFVEMGCDPKMKKEAAIQAGYHPNTAKRTMDSILRRREILDALERWGVTPDKVASVMAGGLDANHPLSKDNKPDWNARAKYVQESNKIFGTYAPTKIQSEEKSIVLHITPEDVRQNQKVKELRGESDRDPF